MKRYANWWAITLAAALLLLGCSRSAPVAEPPEPRAEAPAADGAGTRAEKPPLDTGTSAPPPVEGPLAATLFAAADMEFTYNLYEKGRLQMVTEHLLRDGARLVGVQGDKVYLTWHLLDSGVWRKDPKNPGVMLRYLPPTLVESAWAQQSGDAQVLFRLTPNPEHCPKRHDEAGRACWQLSVVNRGENLLFTFLEGAGPIRAENVSWVRSSDTYSKGRNDMTSSTLSAAQRETWLAAGGKAPGALAEVKPLELSEYTRLAGKHHWDVQPGGPNGAFSEYDVDGDGRKELVRGTLGVWTDRPVSIYRENYTPLLRLDRSPGRHRVTPVMFSAYENSFFLYEYEQDYGDGTTQTHVTMYGYYQGENQPGRMVEGWGWDHKTSSTQATRVTVDPKGQVTVLWELGDPAGHTLTRVYTFTGFKKPAGFGIGAVEPVSRTLTPTRGELIYPTEPAEVLTAAFMAYWLELEDELPRYFASQEAAQRFTQVQQVGRPQYGPGTVKTGRLTPDPKAWHGMSIDPAPVSADGTLEFYTGVGGYEWSAAQWGKAKLVKNSEGRWVIEQIDISGSNFAGP